MDEIKSNLESVSFCWPEPTNYFLNKSRSLKENTILSAISRINTNMLTKYIVGVEKRDCRRKAENIKICFS